MKVTGFTFIRNAIIYDYPIVESIQSILPVCDNFVVAVGQSDDDTLNLIKSIDKEKIRIIETVWNNDLRTGGRVLSVETDKAFHETDNDSDWAFYIQGDEVVHEKYLDCIYNEMTKWKDEMDIDGLLFKYLHFYGSYDYVGKSSRWYNHEIRIIRNNKGIYSYKDAQGFRKGDNEKLRVKPIDAYIYHYGWVKEPVKMQKKQESFHKYWHDENWIEQNIIKTGEFDYSNVDVLALFDGSHPNVMRERILRKNWKFEHNISMNRFSLKEQAKTFLRKYLRLDFSYKNYKIV